MKLYSFWPKMNHSLPAKIRRFEKNWIGLSLEFINCEFWLNIFMVTRKQPLKTEVINFIIESLAFQSILLNGTYPTLDINKRKEVVKRKSSNGILCHSQQCLFCIIRTKSIITVWKTYLELKEIWSPRFNARSRSSLSS